MKSLKQYRSVLRRRFLKTTHHILREIETPLTAMWWLTIEQSLQDLERIRRAMVLPYWLPQHSAELSRLATLGTPSVPEDPNWKIGDYDPHFFTLETSWQFDDGKNVPKTVDVYIGDPEHPRFIVDRYELKDIAVNRSGIMLADVQRDLAWFLKCWERHVESIPTASRYTLVSEPMRRQVQKQISSNNFGTRRPVSARQAAVICWLWGNLRELNPLPTISEMEKAIVVNL